jgi:hypothetical protein
MAGIERATIGTEEQLRIASSQTDQLASENERLTEQLNEVIRKNNYWQRYDEQRESHVEGLTKTNQELQNKVEILQSRLTNISEASNTQQTRSTGLGHTTGSTMIEDGISVSAEVVTLPVLVANLKDNFVGLETERDKKKKEKDDHMALLHEQLEVCVEDFKQERKDRERIQGENLTLKKRLELAEKRVSNSFSLR